MGKFSLENKIKERLKGHEVHVDKRELWKALGIEEEEKDRKAIWFWWFAGLVGIVFVAGIWSYLQKEDTVFEVMQEASMVGIDESVSKTGNETLNESSTSQRLTNIIEDVKAQENQSNDIKSPETKNTNLLKSTRKSSTNSKTEVENIDSNIEKGENNSKVTSSNSDSKNPLMSENAAPNKFQNGIDRLPYTDELLSYKRDLKWLEVQETSFIKPLKRTRMFEFELFGGAGTIGRTITSEAGELDGYLMSRDTSEGVLEHVSVGASLKYIIGGGFYTKLGLTVNRWNEKYSYNIDSDTIEEPVEVPEVIRIDLQGNVTTQYTEEVKITYNTTNWVRYNRLTQIDLPITLGYEHRISRWSVFGEATGILNLKQQFSGYLNTLEQGIETRDPEIFRSRIGVNLGLNAGLGYGITPRIRARLSARYYRSLGSVLLSSTEIDQRYTSFGLRAGIGYLF